MDKREQAHRLKALWKSGRDKYRSFHAVLNEVRKEIGSARLGHWCVRELGISLSVINDTTKILGGIDAANAKAELKAAIMADKAREAEPKAADANVKADMEAHSMSANAEINRLRNENKRLKANLEAALAAARAGAMRRLHCEQCGKPFTAQYLTARYCSGACRVAAHRARQRAER